MLIPLFVASVLLVLYPYLLYPPLIWAVGALRPRPVGRGASFPKVTILIPAFNEADCIEETVRNKLDQNYPRDRLQIIVASDGSTDGTDDIVSAFRSEGVELLRVEGRQGKAAALNVAIRHATGDIVVFSDANSLFAPDAVERLVANFADPEVGYVTGSLQLVSAEASLSGDGISAYMVFENFLRKAETRAGSIIGVNGGVDAIRRTLYTDIPRELITDFVLPLRVLAAGYRVIFDESVQSSERANTETDSEFRMRVRVALRALQGMVHMSQLCNPLRYPLVSFCLISHKLVRYFGFVFLALALLLNALLAPQSSLWTVVFVLQLLCYALGFLGITGRMPRLLNRLAIVPSYLLMSYAAFGLAFFKFLKGQQMATWQPRAG